MSRFAFGYRKGSPLPVPICIPVLLGKSTEIHSGDVLIRTTEETYTGTTTSQYPVVRPLLSGDTVTVNNGVLGVALFDIKTDANGKITSLGFPTTTDNKGKLDTTLLQANILPQDDVSGFLRIYIAAFDPANVFAALSATNDLVSFYTVGRPAGVTCSAATMPSNYTVNIGAAVANSPLLVEDVDTEHAQYNSASGAGRVFVSCRPTFYQQETGTLY